MAKLNIYHLFAAALVLIYSRRRKRGKKKKNGRGRRFFIRPLFADRTTSGAYQSLTLKMKEIDRQKCFEVVRMPPNRFDHLLELIKPTGARPVLNENVRIEYIGKDAISTIAFGI